MINKICRFIFYKLLGWRLSGEPPRNTPKYLYVVVPHTSNWDFIYGWLAIRSLDLEVTIFVKDAFFVWPLVYFCRFFGVAPVNRRESTNFVDSIARQFHERETLAALITPEGTRKKVEALKSGYYHLAKKADVMIVLAAPNYADKCLVLQKPRRPLASFEEDQAQVREFSANIVARNPNRAI